jgi:hypothetical protein
VFNTSLGNRFATVFFSITLAACGGGGSPDSILAQTAPGITTGQMPASSSTSPPSSGSTATVPDAGATPTRAAGAASITQSDPTQARFDHPIGLARAANGDIYVADSGNNTIRKICADGDVVTLAGMPGVSGSADGIGTAARFSFLQGIAVDGAGNAYVVDNSAIRKITPEGVVTTLAGASGVLGDADGPGATARFMRPWGIAADAAGNLFVADTENRLIRKVAPDGTVTTLAGIRGQRGTVNGSTATATFLGPKGIVLAPSGDLYVTDWYGPPAPHIAETSTFVRKIAANGTVSTLAGNFASESGPAEFRDTFAISADSAGNVYVSAQRTIKRITAAGAVSVLAGPVSSFQSLEGLTIDDGGNLYVADTPSNAISKVTQAGAITLFAGQPGEAGSKDVP